MEEEIKYFNDLIEKVQYNDKLFEVYASDDKTELIFGSIGNKENPLNDFMVYRTIYKTIMDLDMKIKISLREAIKYSYSDEVQLHFNLISSSSSFEELLAYYNVENAIFRIITLWDSLAQFYNKFFDSKKDPTRIFYKRVLTTNKTPDIKKYLEEDDDTECEGIWKGNHKYIEEYRNKITHRNSANVPSFSNFDLNIKEHPRFILKRITEDYAVVSKFIDSFLKELFKALKSE